MKLTDTSLASANSHRILMAGDNFGILKRVAFALQHRGHTLIWAESGEAALRTAESEEIDLVISEIDLPDTSGVDVCRRIKNSFYFDTSVVLVGRSGDEGIDSPRAFKAGADDYFASFSDLPFVLAKLEWLASRKISSEAGRDTAKKEKSSRFERHHLRSVSPAGKRGG